MRRSAAVAASVIALMGCGGDESSAYALTATRECLERSNVAVTTRNLDFVATTALGGAFRARVGDNSVTVVFGETPEDAVRTERAYRRFAPRRLAIDHVLRRDRNVVLLWAVPPEDADARRVSACLQG